MQKLWKLKVWITIALLSCSISLSANKEDIVTSHPSTGERDHPNDSVLIAYDDLRTVNAKLIELDYEKQINAKLRNIVSNDSVIIRDYRRLNKTVNDNCKKAIRQRNIAFGGLGLLFFTTMVIIFVK